jgi:Tol biopolymer transport system component
MFKGLARILFVILFFSSAAFSQHYTTPFGQNRIQYKKFDWYFYSTNNFDVYYVPGGQEYALQAIDFLEEEFSNLTDQLGYAPYNKTKIFIYNSIYDLQQSNVGIDGAVYTIGGRTEFVKLQVEVAYPGQAQKFKEDLIYQLTSTLISDMMYGGSLAEIFQNSYLLSLPEWFIDGAARYMSYGWSREMDDYLRDYMSRKKIKKLSRIEGESAAIIGQSIWNYISVRYGESNISNVLNLTRIIRKEENSIANTLGVSFKTFLADWQNYYLLQRLEVEESYVKSNAENIIGKISNSKELITSTVRFNNDANKVAYALLKNGKYQVFVIDVKTGKAEKITSGGFQISGQKFDDQLPLLDWQDNSTIGVILYKRGYLYLNTFNIETGAKLQKPLNRFRQIESFSFNDNGKLAVISGDIDGQNDIFLVAMNRNALRRITNDVFDDLDPIFLPGTAAIVFGSNRDLDSVKVGTVPLETLTNNFNLFLYDLDTTTHSFFRITNTYGEDRQPFAKGQNELYYLSDQRGISNLFKYNFQDSTSQQISNFDKSIISYDLNFNPNRIVYTMLSNGKEHIYDNDSIDLSTNKFTPETPRKRRENAIMVVSRALRNETKAAEADERPKNEISTEDFLFENETENDETLTDLNWIDTDNYTFEDESDQSFETESFFSKYRNFEQKNERIGPIPYSPRFTFNNVITSFLWDPYRNLMVLMEGEVNDVLENYKIKGGLIIKPNLESADLYGEVHYLKYWMDLKLRIDRKNYQFRSGDIANELRHQYSLNKLKLTAALPITHTFRIEGSSILNTTVFTNQSFLSVNGLGSDLANNNTQNYTGGSLALIFDNAVEKEFNLYHGTRALLEYTSNLNVEDASRNFSNLRFDFRHYQKIHKEITWANRVLYGKQMGPAAKTYMLGGMDNWLFSRRDVHGSDDPLAINPSKDNSDLLFNEFVTNLRGLDYNEAFGTDVLVFNSELRIPLFQYLSNGPIKSNFLRNFQLISFVDIGSVWSGKPPFIDGNPITRKFKKGAFNAEIVKFQNPWLGGFGYGIRTVIGGYYVKLDAARPYIDGDVGKFRYYFTLGLDF